MTKSDNTVKCELEKSFNLQYESMYITRNPWYNQKER